MCRVLSWKHQSHSRNNRKQATHQHSSHDENCKKKSFIVGSVWTAENGTNVTETRPADRFDCLHTQIYPAEHFRFQILPPWPAFGSLPLWCTTITFCSAYRVNEPCIRKDLVALSPPALSCIRSLRWCPRYSLSSCNFIWNELEKCEGIRGGH